MISKRDLLHSMCKFMHRLDKLLYYQRAYIVLNMRGGGRWKEEIVKESALDKRLTNKLCICIGHVANRVLKYQSHIIMT